MKREQVSSIIWRCSTTASDATPRSITWLRWSSKLQQSPDRTVHRSWVASTAAVRQSRLGRPSDAAIDATWTSSIYEAANQRSASAHAKTPRLAHHLAD